MATVKLVIKGRVQGVFFRATAKKVATGLNISGNIKNTKEGHVEAIATGRQQQLNKFIEWCRHGPEKAAVEEVNITSLEEINFDEFTVVRETR
jgi:acylphosphatase